VKLSPEQNDEINDLLDWLERCPSRHRHLLACFGFDEFYIGLITIETTVLTFAEKVEAAARGRGFVRKK